MCNCIEQIEASFRDKWNTDRVSMNRKGWVEIKITPFTEKGRLSKHNRYDSIDWKFCPFCGEKRN